MIFIGKNKNDKRFLRLWLKHEAFGKQKYRYGNPIAQKFFPVRTLKYCTEKRISQRIEDDLFRNDPTIWMDEAVEVCQK